VYKRAQKIRFAIIFFLYLFILLIIVIRLFNVQVLNSDDYVKLADSQHRLKLTLYPQRGLIYDRNKKVFALSLKVFSVYAVPRELEANQVQSIARELSAILDLDHEKILKKLNKDKSFVWIKRRISGTQAKAVEKADLPAIAMLQENKRYYPNNELGAHIIGFAGIDEKGLEGIELLYNNFLKGQDGHRALLRDAKQRMLPAFEYEYVPAVNGFNLVLNIDEVIQHIVEQALDNSFEKSNAIGASVVVMNPLNGEIYALANRPTYNLNDFSKADQNNRRNRTVCDYYEPGSTFKIITASAALEERVVKMNDVFFCENGAYRVSRHTLHDHKPHGDLSFVEVIEKSSNIGTVKVAQKLGEQALHEYLKKFAFGKKTNIDMPGESPGFFRDISQWSKLSISAIPIGHEIGVTVLQMVRAMGVIANGGYLVKPRVVQKIIDDNGETIKDLRQHEPKRILSEDTALKMKQILNGVVNNGTGRRAKLNGYEAGGKTGTAQKLDPDGGYSHNKFIASFIGFAPVEHPRFVIAVVFDEPKPYYYGGLVCGPVFKEIAENILKYMNVPEFKPEKEVAPKG